ncbi:hypothetical protein NUW58_g9825 [Xylaria curta]|uniref:Uncharacterized protein n=1 Tax=Xylaria curta TaxID=42375 RepID=A0ACC1MTH8_9PEZI|nr:hypothetical protein NUW58_g9825 [Xylaria curta]
MALDMSGYVFMSDTERMFLSSFIVACMHSCLIMVVTVVTFEGSNVDLDLGTIDLTLSSIGSSLTNGLDIAIYCSFGRLQVVSRLLGLPDVGIRNLGRKQVRAAEHVPGLRQDRLRDGQLVEGLRHGHNVRRQLESDRHSLRRSMPVHLLEVDEVVALDAKRRVRVSRDVLFVHELGVTQGQYRDRGYLSRRLSP